MAGCGEDGQALGLYLSVPFCRAKCSFCNFASGVGTGGAVQEYVRLLCEEIRCARSWAGRQKACLSSQVESVYLGGGTPSLLSPAQLRQIFAALREAFHITPGAEITMEAAPGQIEEALLQTALDVGVNRVSLGVQSFIDRECAAVGRSHTQASCLAEFERLRARGVRSVGADLIAGLPLQTGASWEATLAVATAAELDHLSVYMLEIDDESRLGREVLGGGARLHAPAVPLEELVIELYERACIVLPEAGFAQYEISNFARPGMQSRHNRKYWERAPYLGLGLDAHSMLYREDGRPLRWANPGEPVQYGGAATVPQPTPVTAREAFEETVFLQLRLVKGMPWAALQNFPQSWIDELCQAVPILQQEGLVADTGEHLRLTGRGRVVSGAIFGELLAEEPQPA